MLLLLFRGGGGPSSSKCHTGRSAGWEQLAEATMSWPMIIEAGSNCNWEPASRSCKSKEGPGEAGTRWVILGWALLHLLDCSQCSPGHSAISGRP